MLPLRSRRFALVFSLTLLLSSSAQAQSPTVLVGNDFRYGVGKQFENDVERKKEYLENMLATRIFLGDFTLGFRVEIDKPREFGRDTIGLKEYFAQFRRDGLDIRGGTFYHLVGRGMVMNTFEARPIGFDTQTEGVRLLYDTPEFSAGAWGGILTSPDINNTRRLEEYLIRGASGEVRPLEWLAVGGSYMAASGRRSTLGFARAFDAYLREGWLRVEHEGASLYANYGEKRSPADTTLKSSGRGYGFYGRLGYAGEGFSLGFELKDYRFDLLPTNGILAATRSTRALPFQNMPTLTPVHDKTLLARNPHAPDFSDELGFQFESILSPLDPLTVTVNVNAGSRHNAWEHEVDSSGAQLESYRRVNERPRSFAEFSDKRFSPYWEVFVEGEYEVDDDLTVAAALQRRSNVDEVNGQTTRASTLMLEGTLGLDETDALHAIIELQRAFDSKKILPAIDSLGIAAADGNHTNIMLTLEYSRSPLWSAFTRVEWSSTEGEPGGLDLSDDPTKKPLSIWPVIGGSYRIGTAHTVTAQYGAERGGVVCTGGVCRFINPFSGFRLGISSKL